MLTRALVLVARGAAAIREPGLVGQQSEIACAVAASGGAAGSAGLCSALGASYG